MIPIVDFGAAVRNEPRGSEGYQKVVEEIHSALSEIGFVYLKNHGILQEKIDQYFELSMQFFNQKLETKNKYARPKGSFHGYIQQEHERINSKSEKSAYGDLNESYNYVPWSSKISEIPKFDEANSKMFDAFNKLGDQILEVMGRGLKLKDPFHFIKNSQKIGSEGNETYLRSLYYPPVEVCKQGQLRIGEHTDYGSITILFQDNTGGLEVMNREGSYVQATPIEGTALLNIGDLMQRWTSDRLVSGRHRIIMPDTEEKRKSIRQSFAFFSKPDNESIISCIDNNNKYPPIKTLDYMLPYAKLIYPDFVM